MKAAKAIKMIRQALCLEQQEFAKQIGVTKSSVCNYEKGIRMPRLPTIRKILDLAKKNKIKIGVEDFLDE